MAITHNATSIDLAGTVTGDELRTYVTTNSLGTVSGLQITFARNVNFTGTVNFTDANAVYTWPAAFYFTESAGAITNLTNVWLIIAGGAKAGQHSQTLGSTRNWTKTSHIILNQSGSNRFDFSGPAPENRENYNDVDLYTNAYMTFLHVATNANKTLSDTKLTLGPLVGSTGIVTQANTGTTITFLRAKVTVVSVTPGIYVDGPGTVLFDTYTCNALAWYIERRGATFVAGGGPGGVLVMRDPIKPAGFTGYTFGNTQSEFREEMRHNVQVINAAGVSVAGIRVSLRNDTAAGWAYATQTTSASGAITEQYVRTRTRAQNSNTDVVSTAWRVIATSYGYIKTGGSRNFTVGPISEKILMVADAGVTLTESAASALTTAETLDNVYDLNVLWSTRDGDNVLYPNESQFPIASEGTTLNAGSRPIIIDGAATSAFAINTTSNTVTIKSSALAKGAKFASIKTTGGITVSGVTLSNLTLDGNVTQATPTNLNNAPITGNATFTTNTPTTINLSNSNIGGTISNTGTATVTVRLANSTIGTVGSNVVVQLVASLNLTGLKAGSSIYVTNGSDVQVDYVSSSGTSYTLDVTGGTGTWKWAVKSLGYEHASGSFTPSTGGTFAFAPSIPQKLNADGSAMYTATTSVFCNVVFNGTTQANIDIADGSVNVQQAFDASERALVTAAGLRWLSVGGRDDLSQFLSASGNYLFLTNNWRLRRAASANVNSTLLGFASSTQSQPVDGVNGGVLFNTATLPSEVAKAVWEYNSRALTVAQAQNEVYVTDAPGVVSTSALPSVYVWTFAARNPSTGIFVSTASTITAVIKRGSTNVALTMTTTLVTTGQAKTEARLPTGTVLQVGDVLQVSASITIDSSTYTSPVLTSTVVATDNSLTVANIVAGVEGSTIVAKEATVASRSSQTSNDAIKAKTDLIISNPLPANDARLNNLDSTISSRSTQASNDAIKGKTDNLPAAPAAVGSAMTLTTAERTAVAVAVESSILNESDGQQVLNAIVGAIGNTNVNQVALVAAIRADLERTNGMLDTVPTLAEIEASTVLAKQSGFNGLATGTNVTAAQNAIIAAQPVPPTAAAIRAEIDSNSTKLDVAVSTRLATSGYTVPPTAAAIATATEAAILLDTDGKAVLQAIADKIGNTNLAASTVATAVRTELATELARMDVAISSRSKPADVVNANIVKVNNVLVTGTGEEGTEWGPAP